MRRATRQRGIQITGRDLRVLEAIHRYRMLDRAQVERLFFGGPRPNGQASTAHERLRLLYQHGFVERVHRYFYPGKPNPGPAYRLATHGAALLAQRAGLAPARFVYWGKGDDRDRHPTQVSQPYVEHTLQLAELRMRMEQAATSNGCQIAQWLDHVDLVPMWTTERVWIAWSAPGQGHTVPVTPDGYAALATPNGRGHFFVELDRGTKTIRQAWRRKVLMYKEYLRTGKFHRRYGVSPHTGFRVLVVAPSLTRADHIKAAAETYGPRDLSSLFLCTSFPDVMGNDPLVAPIWRRGGTPAPQALL